jgi:hypothetical protein
MSSMPATVMAADQPVGWVGGQKPKTPLPNPTYILLEISSAKTINAEVEPLHIADFVQA